MFGFVLFFFTLFFFKMRARLSWNFFGSVTLPFFSFTCFFMYHHMWLSFVHDMDRFFLRPFVPFSILRVCFQNIVFFLHRKLSLVSNCFSQETPVQIIILNKLK